MTYEDLLLDPPENSAILETKDSHIKFHPSKKTTWTIRRLEDYANGRRRYRVLCECADEVTTLWTYDWKKFVGWLEETEQVLLQMWCT